MYVCLIRHGDYITEGYSDDSLYPLSDEGKDTMLTLCEKLAEKKLVPNRIYSSPLKRAEESSKIIGMSFVKPYEKQDALKDFDSNTLLSLIQENKGKNLFFVGHAPYLIELANLLCKEDINISKMAKSSAILLQFGDEIEFQQAKFIEYIS